MAEKTPTQRLWQDALTGKISRRDILIRGAALGLSAPILAALAQECIRGTLAAEEGKPSGTFYQWMLNLHPVSPTVGEAVGVTVEEAPTENFGFDRFVAEANEETSTWDFYGGVTPVPRDDRRWSDTGTIEPWTPTSPAGLIEDFAPADPGRGYLQRRVLRLAAAARHQRAEVERGHLSRRPVSTQNVAPATWDDFIANAQQVQDSGAAPYGLTFDTRDWRSLIPVTHSISTDVYTPDGLFQYDSDAAVEALEIMKRMMELTIGRHADRVRSITRSLVDEPAFAAEQVGYYFKYQNAPLPFSATLAGPEHDPPRRAAEDRRLALAEPSSGTRAPCSSSTARTRRRRSSSSSRLPQDETIWQNSVSGNADEGTTAVGQLPVLQSTWAQWETTPPDFVAANPWIFAVRL